MISVSLTIINYYIIILLLIISNITIKLICNCKASPSPPPVKIALAHLTAGGNLNSIISNSVLASETGHVANLTRQHDGDLFIANGMPTCNTDTCVGLSSGTAELFVSDITKSLSSSSTSTSADSGAICECRCFSYLHTYREDLGICVDDIHECKLSPFISGSSSEKIPYVFLPLRGQIIYPSREISFQDVKTPVCAVTSAQYLTPQGWSELRNPLDTDFPFRMFRDEGRTFLQWLGESELRNKMHGRLILVHLMCRDMSLTSVVKNANNVTDVGVANKNIFQPCVAFRISGSPVKYVNNVSEVLFQSESTSNLSQTVEGLSTKEYVVIGICSLLLGLIYVASVFLYLHVKKRKTRLTDTHNSIRNLSNDINYPKNDQVTFGAPFTRNESIYNSSNLLGQRNGDRSRRNSLNGSTTSCNLKEELGIVKNNPLLKHYPNLSDHSGFTSDLSNSNSECEDNHNHATISERVKNMQTSVLVHPSNNGIGNGNNNGNKLDHHERNQMNESSPSPTQENECLPEENVSIIEDMGADEKLENMRAIVNGTIRKKLYFNPAYFEPHLLMSPPPAAIEFLTKIREVIAIAKYKMSAKRYQPSLQLIPEEAPLNGSDIYYNSKSSHKDQPNSNSSNDFSKKSNSLNNSLDCTGCPGCLTKGNNNNNANNNLKNNENLPVKDSNKCTNCGDKRNSIEKWLESVPSVANLQDDTNTNNTIGKEENISESKTNILQQKLKTVAKNVTTNSKQSLNNIPKRNIQAPKCKPPAIPETAPKIVSHSLKTHNSHQKSVIGNLKNIQNRNRKSNLTKEKPISPILGTRMYGQNNVYNIFAESCSEIYNNPKFNHYDSPALSQKSRSSSHRSRSSKKRIEVLDQYANPNKKPITSSEINNQYDILKNIKHMPDMVYEAIAKDYSIRNFNIPTPDYDRSYDKKMKNIYNNTQGSDPSVPTPDYSTLGKKSLRQYQPDSPIYRRKSPQYLIVDYETDSLERNTSTHKKNGPNGSISSPSSSNNSSDACSHPSPSLSTALPLEEEVEIRHTVYDKIEGFRKDGETIIKKINNNNNNNNNHIISKTLNDYEDIKGKKDKLLTTALKTNISSSSSSLSSFQIPEPRIKYNTPFKGSMTIEVEHEPLSDIELSTDSDQFEPDTLDRKPKKHSFCDVKNAWSEHLKKSQNFVNNCGDGQITYSSLENMTSLPEFSRNNKRNDHLVLRLCSSFRSNINNNNSNTLSSSSLSINHNHNDNNNLLRDRSNSINGIQCNLKPIFGSLREIYQSKNQKQIHHRPKLTNIEFHDKQGRLLTLEAKHSKRQRKNIDDSIKKIMPPDIIPENNFYDVPKFHGNKCNDIIIRKNLTGWNTDNSCRSIQNNTNNDNENVDDDDDDEDDNDNNDDDNDSDSDSDDSNDDNDNINGNEHHHLHHHHHHHQHDNHNQLKNNDDNRNFNEDTSDITISSSESTEITGVSDTQANSEFENCNFNSIKTIENNRKTSLLKNNLINNEHEIINNNNNCHPQIDNNCAIYTKRYTNPLQQLQQHQQQQLQQHQQQQHNNNNIIKDEEYSYSSTEYSIYRLFSDSEKDKDEKHDYYEDPDKIEVVSTKSIQSNDNYKLKNRNTLSNDETKNLDKIQNTTIETTTTNNNNNNNNNNNFLCEKNPLNIQTVYRCEINNNNPSSNGMQIAIGLRDRAKKSKDLKNAWKKFISLATSKFNNYSLSSSSSSAASISTDKKLNLLSQNLDRDDGISSLIIDDVNTKIHDSIYLKNKKSDQNISSTSSLSVGIKNLCINEGNIINQGGGSNSNSDNDIVNGIPKRFGLARQFSITSSSSLSYYDQQRYNSSNNNNGQHHQRPSVELDSGYISADSNEVYSRRLYEKYNFKQSNDKDNQICKFDTIEDRSDEHESSITKNRSSSTSQKSITPEFNKNHKKFHKNHHEHDNIKKNYDNSSKINVNLYSSEDDDERFNRCNSRNNNSNRSTNSSRSSETTDEEGNTEDMCESGAESIETNSVLFKNIRNNQQQQQQ